MFAVDLCDMVNSAPTYSRYNIDRPSDDYDYYDGEDLDVDNIIRSQNKKTKQPVTVVMWADGTKTVVKLAEGDQDNPYAAFCFALGQKIYGGKCALKKYVERRMEDASQKKG